MDAVDLGADRRVADVGMHEIGEVDRRRSSRERDQHAFGREAEDLVLIETELRVFVEFLRVVAAFQELHHVAQPFIGLHRGGIAFVDLLAIAPMRGNAPLGNVVHCLGADLDLDPLVLRPHHGGVDRAITVDLG